MTTKIETEIPMSVHRPGARAMIIGAVLLLAVPAFAQTGDEVGGSGPSDPFATTFELNHLDTQLHVSLARLLVTDEDMSEQYDGMWLIGLETSFAMTNTTRFFLSAHYGSTDGDPHTGDPTFDGGDTGLRTAPFRAGLRLNTSENSRLKVDWTAAFQFAWVSEETPVYEHDSIAVPDDPSGWATGLYAGVAPEILWDEGRRSVRLEIGWSGFGADIGRSYQRHDIALTGIWLALGTSIKL